MGGRLKIGLGALSPAGSPELLAQALGQELKLGYKRLRNAIKED